MKDMATRNKQSFSSNKIILDASVIIKWFIEEEDSDKASSYLKVIQDNKIKVKVPSLLFYELGNILLNKKASVDMAGEIVSALQNLGLEVEDIALQWFREIYQNSIDYSITFYDSAYITLMQKENCEFITADKKLFQKVNKAFAGVKLF